MVGDRVVVGYVVGASADIWRSRWRSRWCGLEPVTMGVWQEGCEPRGSADWKNTIEVFHTAGEPPRTGRTLRTASGWVQNTSHAAAKTTRP